MRKHFAYLKYVLRHKWYVLLAALKAGCPLKRALLHDLSKFSPLEWFAYANTFYTKEGDSQYIPTKDFSYAWNSHQKYNKHHWQYWVLQNDSEGEEILEMPEEYVREMLADWIGAGLAIHGKNEVAKWYKGAKSNMKLHPTTRKLVETLISSRVSMYGE